MKRLHLIRHAKSSWDHPGLSDVERPLNKRGLKAAAIMAPAIIDARWNYSHVFSSAAVRAQQTIENIASHLPDHDIRWQVDPLLYMFNAGDLLDWCHKLDDELSEVTIIGHNPAITDFTNRMTGSDILSVPTCGYIQMELTTNWTGLGVGSAKLNTYLTPKMMAP